MDEVTTAGGGAQASGVLEALRGFQGEDWFGSPCSREYIQGGEGRPVWLKPNAPGAQWTLVEPRE